MLDSIVDGDIRQFTMTIRRAIYYTLQSECGQAKWW